MTQTKAVRTVPRQIWVATRNAHKVQEIAEILGAGFLLRSLLDRPDLPDVEETGSSFYENAAIKARSLWNIVREPVFADDSGLEVDALDGRPGIHSNRYSGPEHTHEKNISKLLVELRSVPPERRTARFRCTIVYIDAAGSESSFDGVFDGYICDEPRGTEGFGYDPVFVVPESGKTVAELDAATKNSISHRGRAVVALKRLLENAR